MSMLLSGLTWLNKQRKAHLAETVTYKRGAESISISATLGAMTYEVVDDHGLLVKARSSDFLIEAADLVFGGGKTEPKIGDQIRVTSGDDTLVFEVLDLGGVGVFRYSDPYGKVLRVHAKQIDTE